VRHHEAFTARYWTTVAPSGTDPRDEFTPAPWFDLACRFVDDWDMASFDPSYDAKPLEHFAPLVRSLVTGP
jgi:hypothetical protein